MAEPPTAELRSAASRPLALPLTVTRDAPATVDPGKGNGDADLAPDAGSGYQEGSPSIMDRGRRAKVVQQWSNVGAIVTLRGREVDADVVVGGFPVVTVAESIAHEPVLKLDQPKSRVGVAENQVCNRGATIAAVR